jgi:hypothetical protein
MLGRDRAHRAGCHGHATWARRATPGAPHAGRAALGHRMCHAGCHGRERACRGRGLTPAELRAAPSEAGARAGGRAPWPQAHHAGQGPGPRQGATAKPGERAGAARVGLYREEAGAGARRDGGEATGVGWGVACLTEPGQERRAGRGGGPRRGRARHGRRGARRAEWASWPSHAMPGQAASRGGRTRHGHGKRGRDQGRREEEEGGEGEEGDGTHRAGVRAAQGSAVLSGGRGGKGR